MYYETKFRQRFYWLVVETWGYKSNIFCFTQYFSHLFLPHHFPEFLTVSLYVFIVFFVSRPHRFRHPTSVTCYVISLRVFSPAVRHKLPYRARLVFLFFFSLLLLLSIRAGRSPPIGFFIKRNFSNAPTSSPQNTSSAPTNATKNFRLIIKDYVPTIKIFPVLTTPEVIPLQRGVCQCSVVSADRAARKRGTIILKNHLAPLVSLLKPRLTEIPFLNVWAPVMSRKF
jgi:hypothetical protein